MALEIKKNEKETSQNLIRRFSKRVKMSGILLEARKARFREKRKSKNMRKKSALRREEKRKEYQTLKKLSKTEK